MDLKSNGLDVSRTGFELSSQLDGLRTAVEKLVKRRSASIMAASILARMQEARLADDVERIVLEELHRWYGGRNFASLDRDRLADATIAILHGLESLPHRI